MPYESKPAFMSSLSLILIKTEYPILALYLYQVYIVHNLSVSQQGGLEYISCSK